jgi:hypothetical protein
MWKKLGTLFPFRPYPPLSQKNVMNSAKMEHNILWRTGKEKLGTKFTKNSLQPKDKWSTRTELKD